jgi:hypothetical protein
LDLDIRPRVWTNLYPSLRCCKGIREALCGYQGDEVMFFIFIAVLAAFVIAMFDDMEDS